MIHNRANIFAGHYMACGVGVPTLIFSALHLCTIHNRADLFRHYMVQARN